MKNKIGVLLVILFLFPCLIYSQDKSDGGFSKSREFSIGVNRPFLFPGSNGFTWSPETGFTIIYGYTGRIGKLPFRIGGGLDNFRCNVRDDITGGHNYEGFDIHRNQTNMYFEFAPLVIRENIIRLTLGTVFGLKLVDSGHSKKISYWTTYFGGVKSGKHETNYNTTAFFNFGIKGDLMFEIPIKEKISLAPRYSLTYHVTPLIINTNSEIRGIRQNFDLVLKFII